MTQQETITHNSKRSNNRAHLLDTSYRTALSESDRCPYLSTLTHLRTSDRSNTNTCKSSHHSTGRTSVYIRRFCVQNCLTHGITLPPGPNKLVLLEVIQSYAKLKKPHSGQRNCNRKSEKTASSRVYLSQKSFRLMRRSTDWTPRH